MQGVIITGGIGTGKSTVCRRLRALGVEVIDADTIAHTLLQAHYQEIEQLFGKACVEEGVVNRKTLGEIVFSDVRARKALEALLHPKIHRAMMDAWRVFQKAGQLCVLDIPLYYETQSVYEGFKVALVYAPKAAQYARVKQRDELSDAAIHARLEAQLDIEQKRQWAEYVIDNSRDEAHLEEEIQRFYRWLKECNACK
ncbi:MAG: dephospho-CoA kinase [Campylobacterales bacterium]|nr:dephospho-CoA kinase [Campylobacterales bacterium]